MCGISCREPIPSKQYRRPSRRRFLFLLSVERHGGQETLRLSQLVNTIRRTAQSIWPRPIHVRGLFRDPPYISARTDCIWKQSCYKGFERYNCVHFIGDRVMLENYVLLEDVISNSHQSAPPHHQHHQQNQQNQQNQHMKPGLYCAYDRVSIFQHHFKSTHVILVNCFHNPILGIHLREEEHCTQLARCLWTSLRRTLDSWSLNTRSDPLLSSKPARLRSGVICENNTDSKMTGNFDGRSLF